MCRKCVSEENCACLMEAMERVESKEGLAFIRGMLAAKRQSRITSGR